MRTPKRRLLAGIAAVAAGVLTALTGTAQAAPGECVVPRQLGIVFVLDDSGSMLDNDPGNLRGTATGTGLDQLPDGSLAAASKFESSASEIFPATAVSDTNRPRLKSQVSGSLQSSGGTNYDAAFTEAKRQLDGLGGADKKAVIFLSDGEPNDPYTTDRPIAAAGIPIFTIGFGEAPPAELSGIAQRSGGQAYAIDSASESQEVFARIVSILTCDATTNSTDLSLKPGQTKTFDFDVKDTDRAFRALATWSGGDLTVFLVRPDGSILAPASKRPGETFVKEETYASASGEDPPPGRWLLKIQAQRSNVNDVRVSIDTWQRKPPGDLVYEDSRGAPQPSGEPGCESKLSIGPVEAIASCFRQQGPVYVSQGRVRVNGIDIAPVSGEVTITVDPQKLELRANGRVRAAVGSVFLFEGSLDWSLGATFSQSLSANAKIKGFPINGSADIRFESGVATLGVNVEMPSLLGGVTGSATLKATNDTGLQLDGLSIKVGRAQVGAIPIKNIELAYAKVPEGDRWSGGATVTLPSPRSYDIGGRAALLNGEFASAGAEVDNINQLLAFGVFLQRVELEITVRPRFAILGGMGLSAGPRILGQTAASLDGSMSFTSGDPSVFRISGDLKLVRFNLAKGEVSYKTNGQLDFSGHLDFTIAGFGFEGDLSGFITGRAFNAEGSGKVKSPGPDIGGKGLVSNEGIAGCAHALFIDIGFGYRWGATVPRAMAGSCSFDDYRAQRSARASQLGPGASQAFTLRGGLPAALFSATGTTSPPRITVTGPTGQSFTTGSGNYTQSPQLIVLKSPAEKATFVAVNQPAAGTWRVTVAPGSSPVASIAQANGLPQPRVTARVRGRGHRRKLVWSIRRIPGQRVRFVERGAGVSHVITSTTRRRGSKRFSPADGPAGLTRGIQAVVEQNGLARATFVVATYKAPRPARPGQPRGLRVRRRGSRAVVSWRKARSAKTYLVRVNVSDGRKVLFERSARSRKLRIGKLARGERVTVFVRAVNRSGRAGKASKKRFRVRRRR